MLHACSFVFFEYIYIYTSSYIFLHLGIYILLGDLNFTLLFQIFNYAHYLLTRYEVQGYHNEVNIWFSNAIARPCTLLRCFSSQYYSCLGKIGSAGMCRDVETRLNFVNEAQFLLISEESVFDLNYKLRSSMFYCTLFLRQNSQLSCKPFK